MRIFTRLLTAALLMGSTALYAQTDTVVASFDTLYLSKPDTFYANYTSSGNDVGFNDGYVHFPCIYDTSYGGYWVSGFSYSNMTDSMTSGYTNGYSAKTAKGYNGSDKYVVAYGVENGLRVNFSSATLGLYVTNSTFAYNSMRDGDAFAKKFGGPTGNDPDWFKITVHAYDFGQQIANDSIDFYLADFRFADNDSDYILNIWKWVDLTSLAGYDSLSFTLSSSDTGEYGMNTPAYFCMDNYTTIFYPDAINNITTYAAKIYPNPAINNLFVELTDKSIQQINVFDITGKLIATYPTDSSNKLNINTSSFVAGTYMLQLTGNGKTAVTRFVKQ